MLCGKYPVKFPFSTNQYQSALKRWYGILLYSPIARTGKGLEAESIEKRKVIDLLSFKIRREYKYKL